MIEGSHGGSMEGTVTTVTMEQIYGRFGETLLPCNHEVEDYRVTYRKVKVTPEQATKAQMGSRCIALPFL